MTIPIKSGRVYRFHPESFREQLVHSKLTLRRHFHKKILSEKRTLSGRRDSNPRPRPWQGRALPAELLSQRGNKSRIIFEFANIQFVLFPLTIFLISLSFINASTGVRVLMSVFIISSLICINVGSSNWKKLNCISSCFCTF